MESTLWPFPTIIRQNHVTVGGSIENASTNRKLLRSNLMDVIQPVRAKIAIEYCAKTILNFYFRFWAINAPMREVDYGLMELLLQKETRWKFSIG